MGLDNFLNITYKLASSDNFGAYLDAMGVAAQVREMILAASPEVTLTKNGDAYTVKTSSSIRDHDITFTPGVEYEDVGVDGRTYRIVATVDGNKIINEILTNPNSTVISEYSEDKLVLNLSTGSVKACNIFEKV